jgi:hypothetical protein
MAAFAEVAGGLGADFARLRTAFWGSELYAGAAGFGEAYGDGLFDGARAVLAFANVLDFFANEFARLRGGRFAFGGVFVNFLDHFIFWHGFSFRVSRFFVRRLLALSGEQSEIRS